MNLITALRIAVNALVIHKGRSVLTSLGIIIGTGAVISMVSAAGGARTKLDERLENVGKTLEREVFGKKDGADAGRPYGSPPRSEEASPPASSDEPKTPSNPS